jgi:transposase-like protein
VTTMFLSRWHRRRFAGHRQLGARWVACRREGRYRLGMSPPTKPSYAGYQFPPEVISHAVWLYFRFPLSLRMVEEMLKKQGVAPRVMITDKLASYGAAKRGMMPGVEHRQHKGLNNRAENSHQPTRR